IDTVAEDVAILDDDVSLMDADAELDPRRFSNPDVAAGHRLLRSGGAAQRIDDTRELREKSVAGGLDQPAAMLGDRWVDHLLPDRLQSIERSFLVGPDQPRIAGDISRQYRGEPTFRPVSSLGVHYPTA